jgi:hypothetical protein
MKRLLLGFIIMATWMVVSCGTTTTMERGCFGFWEKNYWGLLRGTIPGRNADYKKPYRQCVDEEYPHLNKERRPYG